MPTKVNHNNDRFLKNMTAGPFSDWPLRVSLCQYQDAVSYIVSRWISLKVCPIAIYQIGQTKAPGFSDLDFIVVLPEGKRIDETCYLPSDFPDWVQELFTHPPYFCTEKSWSLLPGWYPVFDLKHLWGKELSAPTVAPELTQGLALGLLIDYLIIKVPSDFLWCLWQRPVPLRVLANMLNSFKYIVHLARQAELKVPDDITGCEDEVFLLRKSWFACDESVQIQSLGELSNRIVLMSGKLIECIDSQISSECERVNSKVENLEGGGAGQGLFNFESNWDFRDVFNKQFDSFSHSGTLFWVSPASFKNILSVYAEESILLREYFSANGVVGLSSWKAGLWEPGLRYHAKAIIEYERSAFGLGVSPQKYIALGFGRNPLPVDSGRGLFARLSKVMKSFRVLR